MNCRGAHRQTTRPKLSLLGSGRCGVPFSSARFPRPPPAPDCMPGIYSTSGVNGRSRILLNFLFQNLLLMA